MNNNKRFALGIEYKGTHFHGWQKQNQDLRTVQGAVEATLSQLANQPIEIYCAGRTDTGVHATTQVIHFDTTAQRNSEVWLLGGNAQLPADVRVLWCQEVNETFHARFSAQSRCYQYLIYNHPFHSAILQNQVTWFKHKLDVCRMQQAADLLMGEHDFSSFRSSDCQANTPHRRIHHFQVHTRGSLIMLEVAANAFLHHMVRNMVGVLMEIGRGRQPIRWVTELLAKRDRSQAAATAPADGLYLMEVAYEPGILQHKTRVNAPLW